MSVYQVQSRGIYHGLPVYPESIKGLAAIITGANGISGYYMLKALSQSPQRWSKIYCLSRRPPLIPGGLPDNVEHIALDFLKEPAEIAEVLKSKGVKADYVFFYSYIQPPPKPGGALWSDADEMVRVNLLLLSNFLGGLKAANITPKTFMLQTGAKNYGPHLGPTKVPQEESDPRILLEPNFYYNQEDLLFAYCAENSVGWTVGMPGPILGAVPDAAMNACFPLAVYAAVSRHLGRKLVWPGDVASWQIPNSMSTSMMNAYMEEWSVLEPRAVNQRYNVFDGGAFAFEGLWPKVAGWYGIGWDGPGGDESGMEVRETRYDPPPRGYGGRGVSRRKFTLVEWAKRPEVQRAWEELRGEYGLAEIKEVDRVFAFLDGTMVRASPLLFSSDKARKLGWCGYVDSSEAFLEVFQDLVKIKMIPPLPK
jgi:NAD dependent epimerase/dehydratase family